jgi:hypothetical protein
MKKLLLYFCFVLLLLSAGCSKSEPAKPPAPGIGRLQGVRMEIPDEYQFFSVEYEVDEIWTNPPKRHAPGPDVPIRSFSLLLHLPDFAPQNKENEASWLGWKGQDARNNEWIQVGVTPLDGIGKDPARWFSGYIDRLMDGQVEWTWGKANWYFEREGKLVHGLVNEKKIGPDYSKISTSDNTETFYDPQRATTYIVCGTGAGGTKFCRHRFVIPDINALVTASYAKNNLASWRDIQDNVCRIVLSFRK